MISNKILQSIVAKRLEILRKRRELTMSGLAERSGVSKGTLSVLEDGNGNPTISTLWSIADALEVPFNDLINTEPQINRRQFETDGVSVQLIDQTNTDLRMEAYHMMIKANSHREALPHPAGVEEQITVLSGHLLAGSLSNPKLLGPGEHYHFKADCQHIYSAPTDNVSALVTMQYPKEHQLISDYTIVKSVPTTQNEWDDLLNLIDRHSVEVATGLPVFRLVIRTGAEPEIIARNIEARLFNKRDLNYKTAITLYFSPEKEQLCLYIFPKSRGCTYTLSSSTTTSSIIDQQKNKIIAYANANNINLNKSQIGALKTFTSNENLLYATLAAEVLSIQGIPTLPDQMNRFIERQDRLETKEPIKTHHAYQLLHPGYARQILTTGEMLLKYGNENRHILEMGTGAELSLLMLLDLIPELAITALEASSTNVSSLQKNTKQLNINLHSDNSLEHEETLKYPIITFTGESHSLNTAYFLQEAYSLLEEDGILIIADEFIASFNSEKERKQALISHYITYMLDVVGIISRDNFSDFPPNEYRSLKPYIQALPTIAFMAITASVDEAITHLKLLKEKIQAHKANIVSNKVIRAYYHLLNLELDALLAGIDGKIEPKTSVENFFSLAQSSGLELLEHQRVYASFGKPKTEAGTYVLVFKKSL